MFTGKYVCLYIHFVNAGAMILRAQLLSVAPGVVSSTTQSTKNYGLEGTNAQLELKFAMGTLQRPSILFPQRNSSVSTSLTAGLSASQPSYIYSELFL